MAGVWFASLNAQQVHSVLCDGQNNERRPSAKRAASRSLELRSHAAVVGASVERITRRAAGTVMPTSSRTA